MSTALLPVISECVNSKLGSLIHSWSIPAGRTCPGETTLCGNRCYAMRGFFVMPNVARTHQRNYEFSRTPEFVDWIHGALRGKFVRIMRIHCAGDFYDVDYTRKWYEIVRRSPHTTFFAYSRSWRQDDILPGLIQLGSLPNFKLWWSIDRETGPAPLIQGVRRAYMAIDDVDAEFAPDDCDLVFRHNPRTVMKKANGVFVCPPENGVTEGVTCSKCGVCWRGDQRPVWEAQVLPYLQAEELDAPEMATC